MGRFVWLMRQALEITYEENCLSVAKGAGEYDPAALANLREPIFIFGVRSKVVVVDFDSLAEVTQRLRDDFPAEGAVNEKD